MWKRRQTLLFVFPVLVLIVLGVLLLSPRKKRNYPEGSILLQEFGEGDTSRAHMLYRPGTVRSDAEGSVFVLDEGNHRIVKYSAKGEFLQQIGSVGQGPGDLLGPIDFDVDKAGKVYVVEETNKRVSIFESNGRFRTSFHIPAFPQAAICVFDSNEILINRPEIEGSLFDVYRSDGTRVRSFGPVEGFENPPFKGPNKTATWAFNQVRARFDPEGNLNVFYYARPLYRRFTRDGVLLLEKAIEGPEIDTARVYEKRNLERHISKNTNPNSVNYTTFFTDCDLLPSHAFIVGLLGGSNAFYVIDASGNVKEKIRIEKSIGIAEPHVYVWRFTVTKTGNIVASETYLGKLYQALCSVK